MQDGVEVQRWNTLVGILCLGMTRMMDGERGVSVAKRDNTCVRWWARSLGIGDIFFAGL